MRHLLYHMTKSNNAIHVNKLQGTSQLEITEDFLAENFIFADRQ